MLDIHNKLQSTIAQFQNLREFAQRSFVAYIRSIYLMANKDVFDVQSIDCKALAESYGLAVVPRVRFLARAGVIGKQNESRSDWNPSEESEMGRVAEDGVGEKKKEKTASELLEMILKSAKNRKEQVKTENAETERDQQQLSGESDGGGDGMEEEATEGD
ncbi:unnamed protein product, partial [Anisakis simplex]|uniref:DUF4217 domain-containing protein n=1 Tax=Anisakis simplex TaxID=6269 RepID=A0A0M3JC22_ANISI